MEWNISHEASDMTVTENTKIFVVTEFETSSRTYRISGVDSRKEAIEYIDENGLYCNGYHNPNDDGVQVVEIGEIEYEGSKVKKIEMQKVSPCLFFNKEFTGYAKHWRKGEPDYKNNYTCSNNIKGIKSSICQHCLKKIQNGYSMKTDE